MSSTTWGYITFNLKGYDQKIRFIVLCTAIPINVYLVWSTIHISGMTQRCPCLVHCVLYMVPNIWSDLLYPLILNKFIYERMHICDFTWTWTHKLFIVLTIIQCLVHYILKIPTMPLVWSTMSFILVKLTGSSDRNKRRI